MKKDYDIKSQNTRWIDKKELADQKYRMRNHPWSHTNRFIKNKQDRIWTDLVTPENETVMKTRKKKK